MTDLRECRTCAYVIYKTRGLALCGWGDHDIHRPVSLEHFCEKWAERPDPFEPREEEGDE